MRVILSGVAAPFRCRLFVIDLQDNEIRFFSPDTFGPVVWAHGHGRTPQMQARLDRAYRLRESGISFREIGEAMRVSAGRAQQLVKRARRERADECPPIGGRA